MPGPGRRSPVTASRLSGSSSRCSVTPWRCTPSSVRALATIMTGAVGEIGRRVGEPADRRRISEVEVVDDEDQRARYGRPADGAGQGARDEGLADARARSAPPICSGARPDRGVDRAPPRRAPASKAEPPSSGSWASLSSRSRSGCNDMPWPSSSHVTMATLGVWLPTSESIQVRSTAVLPAPASPSTRQSGRDPWTASSASASSRRRVRLVRGEAARPRRDRRAAGVEDEAWAVGERALQEVEVQGLCLVIGADAELVGEELAELGVGGERGRGAAGLRHGGHLRRAAPPRRTDRGHQVTSPAVPPAAIRAPTSWRRGRRGAGARTACWTAADSLAAHHGSRSSANSGPRTSASPPRRRSGWRRSERDRGPSGVPPRPRSPPGRRRRASRG